MVLSQRIDESRSTAKDKALQANYSGRAEVAAVARHGRAAGPGRPRRLPGSDLILADTAHRLGHCLRRRDGQLSAKEPVMAPYLSIYLGRINTDSKYWNNIFGGI